MKSVAFITGAGRRIGRHLAIRFAERGWRVVVHYGSSEDGARATLAEIESLGAEGMLVQADVRNSQEITAAVELAAEQFGRIDLLINNAGIYPPAVALEDVTEELWREVLETNLYGEFFTAQAVARVMSRQDSGGRIVNLASLGAFQIWRDRLPYNVSKAAVVQLTRALARALAPKIMVNGVAPGVINIPDDPSPGTLLSPSRIPMQRHGTTDDIFRAVWYFAVDAGYVTGQTLLVDGGLNIAQETSQE